MTDNSSDNQPDKSFFAGIAGFDRQASLKKTVTQVTRRDGSVVEETLTGDGSYHERMAGGETKDMSYLAPRGRQIRRPDDIPLDPNAAWNKIQESQVYEDVPTIAARDSLWNTPQSDCTRIVCMSDTHGHHRDITVP